MFKLFEIFYKYRFGQNIRIIVLLFLGLFIDFIEFYFRDKYFIILKLVISRKKIFGLCYLFLYKIKIFIGKNKVVF